MDGEVLEIDMGNTRLKWRLLNAKGGRIDGGALSYDQVVLWSALLSDISSSGANQIVCVRVASVASVRRLDELRDWCRESFSVEPVVAAVKKDHAGVRVGYDEFSVLGVDRWLGMLAAHQLNPEGVLVIDCGSAITIDILRGGCHAGGYIVPGLRLMAGALFRDTDAIKVDWSDGGQTSPGRNTAQAVNHGLLLMAASFIVEVQARENLPRLILTGGDATALAAVLCVENLVVPELVLDGLRFSAER